MSKTAIVIGATGLIGTQLTQQLINNDNFDLVKVFVRREIQLRHPKLEVNIVDFEKIDTWRDKLNGDVLFSALGTTIKKAKNKETQYKVDFTFQYETAKAAAENKVNKYVLVSSAGADPNSRVFYSRIKGELEEAVKQLSFERIVIFRPSLLVGKREEKRFGEEIGAAVAGPLLKLIPFLKKYRPIEGSVVAEAMINAALDNSESTIEIIELDKIFESAG